MSPPPTRWIKPDTDMVKVNFDGAISEHQKAGGLGVIIRDSEGVFLDACSVLHEGIHDPLISESLAAL
ncbi:hypothetical protein REPUB_Repub07fG0229100 [Reevesia pubescens]